TQKGPGHRAFSFSREADRTDEVGRGSHSFGERSTNRGTSAQCFIQQDGGCAPHSRRSCACAEFPRADAPHDGQGRLQRGGVKIVCACQVGSKTSVSSS